MYLFASKSRIPAPALRLAVIPANLKTAARRLSFILLFVTIFITHETSAQDYGYRHYGVKDGLAGSTVYDIYQDKEGFIWVATETGVSRFDGTRFKNFTTRDGLPDNTIIRIYGDSKGRVWLVPFKHTICYYYDGKIYNQQNDTLLQKIKLTDYALGICEDGNGNILLLAATGLYSLTKSNQVSLIRKFVYGTAGKICTGDSGSFFVSNDGRAYKRIAGEFIPYARLGECRVGGSDQMIMHDKLACWLSTYGKMHIKLLDRNIEYDFDTPPVNTIRRINDSLICLNTTKGTLLLNIISRKIEKHFLANKNVSNFLTDDEGGLWFSTLNDGIYHLSSTMLTTFATALPNGQKLGVYGLQKYNKDIWAALEMGHFMEINDKDTRLISIGELYNLPMRDAVSTMAISGDRLALGSSVHVYLQKGRSLQQLPSVRTSVKDIAWKNDKTLLVATAATLHEFTWNRQWTVSVPWQGRTTSLLCRNDSVYFGTLNGLYVMKPDKTTFFFGDKNVLLQSRISAIKGGANGVVWVATGGEGVIELEGDRVVRRLGEEDGLCSNLVRCLAVDTGCLWLGTDKGMNKIDIRTNPVTVTKYSSADGLPADIINALLIDGNTIYAGTPEGITFFNKREQFPASRCNLKMQAVYINGKETPRTTMYRLKHAENDIRFEYVAISFKAAGDIEYAYRLNGVDTAWKTTRQTSLEFLSLPPGAYTFELRATNKFGVKSQPYTVALYVQAPFWKTTWFFILCLLASAAGTWGIFTWRNNYNRNKEAEKKRIEQELLELEQKALRAQMNPHFIFNCLNSVQGYIFDKDTVSANKYLSQFAHLIRQTLDNSLQSLVTVADETKYINTYLDLERLRFKNKFTFSIQNNLSTDPDEVLMPGMLLQPFIENAIHHGIQHRSGYNGHIDIRFFKIDKMICCAIKDNGIGRKEAMTLKSARPGGYQSRGIQLIRERIRLINKGLDTPISVEITDHTDDQGRASGTEVMICIPEIKNKP